MLSTGSTMYRVPFHAVLQPREMNVQTVNHVAKIGGQDPERRLEDFAFRLHSESICRHAPAERLGKVDAIHDAIDLEPRFRVIRSLPPSPRCRIDNSKVSSVKTRVCVGSPHASNEFQ